MLEKYRIFTKKLSEITLLFLSVLGVFMLLLTLIAVFFRYIIGNSIGWAEEVLKISLVWFGLFSVSVIAYRREHIGVVVFKELFPKRVQHCFELIAQVLVLIISIVMCYSGFMLTIKSKGSFTPALRLPYGIAYASIPSAFFIMTLYEIRNTITEVLRFRDLSSQKDRKSLKAD